AVRPLPTPPLDEATEDRASRRTRAPPRERRECGRLEPEARGTAPCQGERGKCGRRRGETDPARYRAPGRDVGAFRTPRLATEEVEKMCDPGGFLSPCQIAIDLYPVGPTIPEGNTGLDRKTAEGEGHAAGGRQVRVRLAFAPVLPQRAVPVATGARPGSDHHPLATLSSFAPPSPRDPLTDRSKPIGQATLQENPRDLEMVL